MDALNLLMQQPESPRTNKKKRWALNCEKHQREELINLENIKKANGRI